MRQREEKGKKMKKGIVAILLAGMMTALLSGCGNKENPAEESGTAAEETTEASENGQEAAGVMLADYDVSTLVTLGEYKGLEVTVAGPAVDEAQQAQYVKNLFQQNMKEELGVKDRAVKDGDVVYISYVGTKDGEAFSGGTSEGTFLEIGSHSYIDGFEDGLIGVMPGETVDLDLTFPEGYQNTDLAGQDVVFNVTVIYIMPEMSDEIISALENENFSNVEELNQYVYDQLLPQAQSQYEMNLENAVIEALIGNCTFTDLPQELVDKYTANIINNMTQAASSYGYDVDSYTMLLYGQDSDSISKKFGEDSAKQAIVFQQIANTENLNVSDEELDENLQQYVEDYNLSSIEELLGDTNKEDYRDFFMFEKVVDFLIDNAVVHEE